MSFKVNINIALVYDEGGKKYFYIDKEVPFLPRQDDHITIGHSDVKVASITYVLGSSDVVIWMEDYHCTVDWKLFQYEEYLINSGWLKNEV